MEWVEVEGKSVEVAIQAGLEELGISSVEEAEVEVIKEPERGFLGFGGSMALVRVKPKPKRKRRRRGGRRRGGRSEEQAREGSGDRPRQGQKQGGGGGERRKSGDKGGKPEQRSGRRSDGGQGRGDGRKPRERQQSKGREKAGGGDQNRGSQKKGEPAMQEETTPTVDIDGQAEIVQEFLTGLLDAFGLEGEVSVRVEEGIVFADVTGEQTEALVGNRGVILQSILELCRTVVQRKSHASARIRLDIAGYTERRREALRIYATRLAEQVLGDGEEVMMEPMNPADRKVVHDAVGEIDDVRTYSEGEEPNRSVVIGLAPGAEPRGAKDSEDDAGPRDGDDVVADEGSEVDEAPDVDEDSDVDEDTDAEGEDAETDDAADSDDEDEDEVADED